MADYVTLTELKARINIPALTTDHDTVLTGLITDASRAVDGYCNRSLDGFVALSVATARLYYGDGTSVQRIDECTAITLVEVKDSATDSTYVTWTTDDWIAFMGDPQRPNFNRTPYDKLMIDPNGSYVIWTNGGYVGPRGFRPETDESRYLPTVRVTAKWGYATVVPGPVKEATAMLATRWFKRLQGAMSDTLASPEIGGTLMYKQEIDPDIKMALKHTQLIRPAV